MYLTPVQKTLALVRTLQVDELRSLPLPVLWRIRGLLRAEKFTRLNGRIVINSFLPPFPSEAFRRLALGIQALRRGEVIPVSAYVGVTDACRYHCWHCSRGHRRGAPMSTAVLLKAVAGLQDLGVSIVGFTGGEPLLQPDLEDVVRSVDGRAVSLLFTTGDGLTDARCRRLREAGLFGAAISLDHWQPEVHDRRRGHAGAFASAVAAVRLCRANGLYTMIQLVATRELATRAALDRYLELAHGLGVHEIRLLEPMPTGCLADAGQASLLSPAERLRLREAHLRTNRRHGLPKICAFAQIEHEEQYGCGAGFQHLYIDPQGNVCPCDFTPISFGNVNTEEIPAIWARLRAAFARPRRTCFLMENAARLGERAGGGQPVPCAEARETCRFAEEGVPRYYRMLGWTSP